METKDLAPIIISVLSLLVSAYTLYMQYRQGKEQLKVTVNFGFVVTLDRTSEPMLLVEAANTGERVITLSSYGLQLPNKKVLIMPYDITQHVTLPHELLAGKSCTMRMPTKEVAKALLEEGHTSEIELKPIFSAQSGTTFKGKPIKFSTNLFLK